MTFRRIGIAAAVAMMAFGAPAFAQKSVADLSDAQQDELYCVYDRVEASEDFEDVGNTILDHIDDEDPVASVASMITKHSDACKTKYGWNENATTDASAVGALATAISLMEEYLFDEGYSEADIDTLYKAATKLEPDDLDALVSAEWVTDTKMQERAMARLAEFGYPKEVDQEKTDKTLTLIELNLLMFYIANDWAARVLG